MDLYTLHLVEQTKVGCFESDAEFEIKILEENQVLLRELDELKRPFAPERAL